MCTIQELFYDKAKSFVLAYFSVHHLSTSVYKTKQNKTNFSDTLVLKEQASGVTEQPESNYFTSK